MSTTATISTVSDDLSSKLCAEIEGDFSNKKFVFLGLINAINSGTAGFLKVKFTPYFNGNLLNNYLERQINLNNSEGYKFICEGVEFECDVDKIQIEIIFYGGQNLKISNLMFFEHEYGKYVFYDQNKLVYKIKNNI